MTDGAEIRLSLGPHLILGLDGVPAGRWPLLDPHGR